MNILCITHELARNGAVICLLGAVCHLRAQDHRVTIFVAGPEPDRHDSLLPEFEKIGVKIIRHADGEPYDLAIVNTIMNYPWVNRLAGKVPVAWWIHEGISVARTLHAEAGVRQAIAAADQLIFPNPNADVMFAPLFGEIARERRSIVSPAISAPAPVTPADKAPGTFRVISVGSLCPNKRQSDLLAAAESLSDLPIECVLIGEKLMVEGELAEQLAAGRVSITATGGLSAEQVQAYYRSADAFCLSSNDESFGMAPLEASLHRLPILLSDLDCYKGIWAHGRNALIHPVGDRLLLAAYLRALFLTPELGRRIGQAAEKTSEAFSEARFKAALDIAIEAAIARSRPRPQASVSRWGKLFGRSKAVEKINPLPRPAQAPKGPAAVARSLPAPSTEVAGIHAQAMALVGTGDLAKAADILQGALEQVPDDLRCLTLATMVQTFLKNLKRAEELGRRAVELAPDLAAAHVNLGNCLFEQGRFQDALASFADALALQPDHSGALLNCGHCLARLDRPLEAAGRYQEALTLALATDEIPVLAALGRAFLGLDKPDLAGQCLIRVLERDPAHRQAREDYDRLRGLGGGPMDDEAATL